jgi:tetratricopeptide (TPR) repeat protein
MKRLEQNLLILLVIVTLTVCAGCGKKPPIDSADDRFVLHHVANGETLEKIADDYYGDPSRADELKSENDLKSIDVEPDIIIRIPMTGKDIEELNIRKQARIPYNKGLELAARGNYLKAIQKFQDALSIDPEFVDAQYNLGVTYQKMKEYDKAIGYFKNAARSRPYTLDYHFALGNCCFHLEKYSRAVDAFEKVLDIDSGNLKACYSLAVCFEKLGKNSQARKAWEDYIQMDPLSEWAQEARKHLEKLKP